MPTLILAALLVALIIRQEKLRMTFAEYAAQQAEQQAAVMAKLDDATGVIADELNEVSTKLAALEDAIRDGNIDQAISDPLLAKTAEIGQRVDVLKDAVENILPNEEPEPTP